MPHLKWSVIDEEDDDEAHESPVDKSEVSSTPAQAMALNNLAAAVNSTANFFSSSLTGSSFSSPSSASFYTDNGAPLPSFMSTDPDEAL